MRTVYSILLVLLFLALHRLSYYIFVLLTQQDKEHVESEILNKLRYV